MDKVSQIYVAFLKKKKAICHTVFGAVHLDKRINKCITIYVGKYINKSNNIKHDLGEDLRLFATPWS